MSIATVNPVQREKGVAALVLVVDDQVSNIQTVGALLSQSGYDVMPATSGDQALQRAKLRRPDLMLLDMLMPGMDGFEVCQRWRSDPDLAAIPIIFLTAAIDRDFLVRAFDSGAVDYVTKPFVSEELLARVRTHIELKRARDHLKRYATECTELTQIVAHDLKNPLSSIQFSAMLMRRDPPPTPERMQRLVSIVLSSSSEALSFVQQYLGRWADGELQRHQNVEAFELLTIVEEALNEFLPVAEIKGMRLIFERADAPEVNLLSVRADRMASRHILNNLISNAIKYGAGSSDIEIQLRGGNPGFARVDVLDRGPGISASDQEKLFRRYVRLGTSTENESTSSGLGLAISKQEASQMGGDLWYTDRPGGGACFSFELPLAPL